LPQRTHAKAVSYGENMIAIATRDMAF